MRMSTQSTSLSGRSPAFGRGESRPDPRQFSLSKDNGGLVPLADLFNMATSDTVPTVRPAVDEENRIYRLYAESSIKVASP